MAKLDFPAAQDYLARLSGKDIFKLYLKKHYFNESFLHSSALNENYSPNEFRKNTRKTFDEYFENLGNNTFFGSYLRYKPEEEKIIQYECAWYPWMINKHFYDGQIEKAKNKINDLLDNDELYGGFYLETFRHLQTNLKDLFLDAKKYIYLLS